MKKNFTKKLVAISLAVALSTSSTALTLADAADEGGTIEGTTDIISGVIDMVVPANADASINPLELTDAGSQIKTGDWTFINHSNVAVKVGLKIALADPASGLVIATAKKNVNDYDGKGVSTVTAKQVYVEAVPAKTLTLDGNILDADAPVVYADAGAILDDKTKKYSEVDFYLKEATIADDEGAWDDSDSVTDKSFAVMRLKGIVNPYAEYAAEDFAVETIYKVTGVKASIYNTYDAATATRDAKGLNVNRLEGAVAATTTPTLTSAVGVKSSTSTATVKMAYTLGSGGDATTGKPTKVNVTSVGASGTVDLLGSGWGSVYCTVDNTDVIFQPGLFKYASLTTGTKTVEIVFADGKKATATLTVN